MTRTNIDIDDELLEQAMQLAGIKANIDIATGAVLAGAVPKKDLRRIRAWLVPRRSALTEAFHAALRHEATDTIVRAYREATDGL